MYTLQYSGRLSGRRQRQGIVMGCKWGLTLQDITVTLQDITVTMLLELIATYQDTCTYIGHYKQAISAPSAIAQCLCSVLLQCVAIALWFACVLCCWCVALLDYNYILLLLYCFIAYLYNALKHNPLLCIVLLIVYYVLLCLVQTQPFACVLCLVQPIDRH